MKQKVIDAIIDTISQKNLISTSLVQRLGLETTPHPKLYPLGWIHKDVEMMIIRWCIFKFAITNKYIDEVTCEMVPFDICQVIFRSPYLWDQEVIFYCRPQQYMFLKEENKFIIKRDWSGQSINLMMVAQATRIVNMCLKFVLLIIWSIILATQTLALASAHKTIEDEVLQQLISKYPKLLEERNKLPPRHVVEHKTSLSSMPLYQILACTRVQSWKAKKSKDKLLSLSRAASFSQVVPLATHQ